MPNKSMRAVRIKLTQQLASYRIPGSYVIRQSFPLPPYSSVIGMIHAACGLTKYCDMRVSIQGNTSSSVSEPYTHYSFNNGASYDKTRHNVMFDSAAHEGRTVGATRGMLHVELLTDVELLLHIVPTDPAMIETIAHGMLYPKHYLSLGRHEDIVRVDEVKIVELQDGDPDEGITLLYNTYVPINLADGPGTVYSLNKTFETPNAKNKLKVRRWNEQIKTRLASKGTTIEDTSILIDVDNEKVYGVFLA